MMEALLGAMGTDPLDAAPRSTADDRKNERGGGAGHPSPNGVSLRLRLVTSQGSRASVSPVSRLAASRSACLAAYAAVATHARQHWPLLDHIRQSLTRAAFLHCFGH